MMHPVLTAAAALVAGLGAPPVPYGPGPGGAIPDPDPIGFLSPIVIEPSFPIDSIAVRLIGLDHGYCSDLTIDLRHAGVSLPTTLCENIRFGNSADFDGTYTFSDSGADLWVTCDGLGGLDDIPEGSYQASGAGGAVVSLDARYAGEDAHGVWTLRLADDDFLVAGAITGWELIVTGGPACGNGPAADLDGDGEVTFSDLLMVLDGWGMSCP